MKTAETHTTATQPRPEARSAEGPFFQRDADQGFFGGDRTAEPFFSPATIQPKLKIGAPDDAYEKEADQMADQVVQRLASSGAPEPEVAPARPVAQLQAASGAATATTAPLARAVTPEAEEELQTQEEEGAAPIRRKAIFDSAGEEEGVQRKCAACAAEEKGMVRRMSGSGSKEPEPVQRKCAACEAEEGIQPKRIPAIQRSGDGSLQASDGFSSRLQRSKGGGSPMSSDTRSSMEGAMGADFSGVRVHTGSEAASLSNDIGAQAFTHGADVYFNEGKYDPGSSSGQHLLAHELVHTVQQNPKTVRRYVKDEENQTLREASDSLSNSIQPPKNELDLGFSASVGFINSNESSETNNALFVPTEVSNNFDKASNPFNANKLSDFSTKNTSFTESGNQNTIRRAITTQTNKFSIQAAEDDSSWGVGAAIRRRLNSVINGVKGGWGRLSQLAANSFSGIDSGAGNILQNIQGNASAAFSVVQNGWSGLSSMANNLTNGLQGFYNGAINRVRGVAQGLKFAIQNLDANALSNVWIQIKGLVGGVWRQFNEMGQQVFQRLRQLWQSLGQQVNQVIANISARFQSLFNRLTNWASQIGQRIRNIWNNLQNGASRMGGVVQGILNRLRSLIQPILSYGQRIWQGIQQRWGLLKTKVINVFNRIRQSASEIWQKLQQKAYNFWNRISGLWNRLKQRVRKKFENLLGNLRELWNGIRSVNIGEIVDTITKVGPFLRAAVSASLNPGQILDPVSQSIAAKLDAGMPHAAENQARQKVGSQGDTVPTTEPESNGNDLVIQKQDDSSSSSPPANSDTQSTTPSTSIRPPLTGRQIWEGYKLVLGAMWDSIKANPLQTIKTILWEMLAFWETVPREWDELVADLGMAWDRMWASGMGFWRHLVDLILIIWRRVNNILMHLFPLFVVLSTVVGAVAGGIGGTVGGAIITFMVGGAGAVPGAGVGIVGGAGIGFGFALGVGEGLLASFIAAELVSLLKAWIDLYAIEQTEDEQIEDVVQMVKSSVGAGIAILLLALSAIGGRIVQGLLSRIRINPSSVLGRFLAGLRAGFQKGSPFRRGDQPYKPVPPDTPEQMGGILIRRSKLRWLLGESHSETNLTGLTNDQIANLAKANVRSSVLRQVGIETEEQLANLANQAFEHGIQAGQVRTNEYGIGVTKVIERGNIKFRFSFLKRPGASQHEMNTMNIEKSVFEPLFKQELARLFRLRDQQGITPPNPIVPPVIPDPPVDEQEANE